jgi:predicted  nucleic acid-binding Zn-ribbon protein
VTEGIQLERELNAANDRIKELEAKVDELHDLEKWLEGR